MFSCVLFVAAAPTYAILRHRYTTIVVDMHRQITYDPIMKMDQVAAMLKNQIDEFGSQVAWARTHSVSPSYVSGVLLGQCEPGKKILDALGLEKLPAAYRAVRK